MTADVIDEQPENAGRDSKGRFQPGVSGCPSGKPAQPNHRNRHLRDAIIEAARRAGEDIDPNSSDGVTAYLHSLAKKEPKSFTSLLGRVLPTMPVKVPLPVIEKPADLVAATSAVATAVSEGELSTSDASGRIERHRQRWPGNRTSSACRTHCRP